ncbi:hypothetical protein [Brevundimonas sp. MEB006b]|uniref:hypothetical protein n=1 Tax=Brevundimonas sp. MEB006b TaxID=3040283 RepID=UPI00254B0162|nr:hypothetical protein [Brevundimonas sp. MEB006b]
MADLFAFDDIVEPDEPAVVKPVVVPDRFESLRRRAGTELSTIVQPVPESLEAIDQIFRRMKRADRGAFAILKGSSGAGKSTFLHTVGLYRTGVETTSVPGGIGIRQFFDGFEPTGDVMTIVVLEEREAAIGYTDNELEDWLHAINGFIRSEKGRTTLVVWPCNTDAIRDRVVKLADAIGAEALLGPSEKWLDFEGPPKTSFVKIAENTLSTLNQGATLSDLGLTDAAIAETANSSATIGGFLSRITDQIGEAQHQVETLLAAEQCRLWIIVAAGSDVDGDVASLTRGRFSQIDTERLMSSTNANIVQDLQRYPDKIGILGTVLGAKILHLPLLTATAIARSFADETLKKTMREAGLSLKPDRKEDAKARLLQTEMAAIFQNGTQGPRPRGKKPGSESVEAFRKLAAIASSNDVAVNRAVGTALQHAGLVTSFQVEQDFGKGLTRRTDILAQTDAGPLRIELMWRSSSGRSEIANYTLTKLANYGRALGYLD